MFTKSTKLLYRLGRGYPSSAIHSRTKKMTPSKKKKTSKRKKGIPHHSEVPKPKFSITPGGRLVGYRKLQTTLTEIYDYIPSKSTTSDTTTEVLHDTTPSMPDSEKMGVIDLLSDSSNSVDDPLVEKEESESNDEVSIVEGTQILTQIEDASMSDEFSDDLTS